MKNIRGFECTYPKVGKPIYIDPSSTVIGNVELGDHVSVWPHAVIRGDDAAIHVGSWTNIQDNCVVHGDADHDTPDRRILRGGSRRSYPRLRDR